MFHLFLSPTLVHNHLLCTLHYHCSPCCDDCKMFSNPSPVLGNLLFKLPIETLKSPISNNITCSFKLFWKVHSLWGSQWFDLKLVLGCEQNSGFPHHEFKITNSFSWSQNEVVTSFLRIRSHELRFSSQKFIHMNSWGFSACYVANGLYCTVQAIRNITNFSRKKFIRIRTNSREFVRNPRKIRPRIRAWIRARIHMPEDYVFKEKIWEKYQYL